MSKLTLTQQLARFISGLRIDDIPQQLVYKSKIYFLDWLGCAFAGTSQAPTRILLDVIRDMGGTPESTVIPGGFKTMCLLAAMVNGAASHAVEMDDLHRESIFHPASAIIPAAFAAAERGHVSGVALIEALIAGYEVGIRVAVAAGPNHYKYWHTTATCGTFGAGAAAARVLNLNEEQTAWALGSAGTQAAGLWEFLVENAMSKQLHPGKAAMNGLLAALLADRGFIGPLGILEGEKGFFRATSQDFDEEKCIANLGQEFLSEENSLKHYASCGHTHSAIEATLKAAEGKAFGPEEIKAISVSTYWAALDLLKRVEPKTPYMAKFNLPFCVATAVRYGRVDLRAFTEGRLEDLEIRALMKKVSLHVDPELDRNYPKKWPSKVEIVTRDGRRLVGVCDYAKGDPRNPLSEDEVVQKFKDLTEGIIPYEAMKDIIDRVMNLESLKDVTEIFGEWRQRCPSSRSSTS